MTKYTVISGSPYTERDAEVIGPEIERLTGEGMLTSGRIIQEAQSEGSPLHPYFEWDDSVAGHLYRIEQAKGMIRAIAIAPLEDEKPIRAFHRVRIEPDPEKPHQFTKEKQIVSIETVKSNPDLIEQVLNQAKREFLSLLRRNRIYKTEFTQRDPNFLSLFDTLEKMELEEAGV